MKKVIYFVCFLFIGISSFAQDSVLQGLAKESKLISTKISQKLNFDDDKTVLLQRAIYTKYVSLYRAEEQMSDMPEKLEATKEKIDKSFSKNLSKNFSAYDIKTINKIIDSK